MFEDICAYHTVAQSESSLVLRFKDKLQDLTDIFYGILQVCRENFTDIRALSLKLGGFGEQSKIQTLFSMLVKHKKIFIDYVTN